ncbi:SMP-30/gluconolactonase/LRE family protein [Pelagicoccus albus]|uniref:SMP-30/gluconolactonase/LRE family protein n=1 Tax=Pelagicoccus albus TaxID=415222 RepID=A0A7X1EAK9_9BACT|nr:SMP-30/gluconolactonase/LRE family protein [Pelagicoccus albus]MBC2606877.1 SMP-30/gluconolactonase/LRE family protein [Pelagicoccus albus]
MIEAKCVYHDRAELGEGVLWSESLQRLYWIDILGERVCRFDPKSGKNEAMQVGQAVGTVAETKSGELLLGLKDGVYQFNFETGEGVKLCDPMAGDPLNRLNDGKAGPDGRFYVGCEGPENQQCFYRVERNGSDFSVLKKSVTCSNGLAWSGDSKTMYYIDSPERVVWAYDFDIDTGSIRNERVVVDVRGSQAVPDGMTIDAEGMLWVAFWDGGCVRRFDPQTGKALLQVDLPVSKVTSCAFGGEDLDTLYISTASVGFEESDWDREPLAGGVFSCKPGVSGVASYQFG